jgi:hypothetical protein
MHITRSREEGLKKFAKEKGRVVQSFFRGPMEGVAERGDVTLGISMLEGSHGSESGIPWVVLCRASVFFSRFSVLPLM